MHAQSVLGSKASASELSRIRVRCWLGTLPSPFACVCVCAPYRQSWRVTPKKKVMSDGDVLYVRSGLVEDWAEEILPGITKRFVLITHNEPHQVPAGVK